MATNSINLMTIPIFMMFFVSKRVFKSFLQLSVLFRKPYGYDAALRQSLMKLRTPFLTNQVLVLLITKVIIWWPFNFSSLLNFE